MESEFEKTVLEVCLKAGAHADYGFDGPPCPSCVAIFNALCAEAERVANNENSVLTVHIRRNWTREKLEVFCLHLLGDKWQSLESKINELDAEILTVKQQRDAEGDYANELKKELKAVKAENERLRNRL